MPPPPPPFFTQQPTITQLNPDGGIIAYGTADGNAEDVLASISAAATATDLQVMREAVSAITTAGVSVSDTKAMVEALAAAATVTAMPGDKLAQVESLLSQLQAFPSVQDIYQAAGELLAPFAWSQQPTVQSSTADSAVIAYGTYDTQAEDVATSAGVTAGISEILTRIDNLLTQVAAIPSVSDLMTQVEAVSSTAEVGATVLDEQFSGVAEQLSSAAEAIASATDMQQMVEGVTVLATAGAGLSEINSYLMQVTTAADARVSVADILIRKLVLLFNIYRLPAEARITALPPEPRVTRLLRI